MMMMISILGKNNKKNIKIDFDSAKKKKKDLFNEIGEGKITFGCEIDWIDG